MLRVAAVQTTGLIVVERVVAGVIAPVDELGLIEYVELDRAPRGGVVMPRTQSRLPAPCMTRFATLFIAVALADVGVTDDAMATELGGLGATVLASGASHYTLLFRSVG
ncbi:MAG: hypothetical protein KA604_00750 [Candidatus Saccharimonas sp.]|nr:hypothetical protein [Candidatus Saccharimonas sp.]